MGRQSLSAVDEENQLVLYKVEAGNGAEILTRRQPDTYY